MKKSMFIGVATLLAVMLGSGALYAETTGPEMMDQERGSGFGQGYGEPQQGGRSSPYAGPRNPGDRNRDSGMMGRGRGMGPDQRSSGWGTGSGMMDRIMSIFSGMMGRGGRGMGPDQRGSGWGRGSGGCR
jgi:hypothetical protein